MKLAISAIRTKDIRINRHELVTSLQNLGYKVVYVGQESDNNIHSDYEKYNVEFLEIPIERNNTNPFKEIKLIIKARKVFKKNKVEVLIAYGIRTFPALVIAAKLAGVKKILCIVNGSGKLFQLSGIKGAIVKLLSYPMLWLSLLLTNNVLFQNIDDLNMIKSKGLLQKQNYGLINGSGVNLNEYGYSELEKRPIVSMISRLTASKGVNEYIKAASIVKKKIPNAVFNLIGPIEKNSNINEQLFEHAIKNKIVNLIDKVEDVRPYIKACRIFVLPSYYPEGVPRSILEAMAMGRPIITTNLPGCKETVVNGRNGFLIPPRDTESLSKKIIYMLERDSLVNKMGIESRKICEDKFNVHKINQIIISKIQ